MAGCFADFVKQSAAEGQLIVQPRMGFSQLSKMQEGLIAVRDVPFPSVGTITVDSFTRNKQYGKALKAINTKTELNGYPILAHGPIATRDMLGQISENNFFVQVRHGTALPDDIFAALPESGVFVTEGGPVSYCLPYSQVPLIDSIQSWANSCERYQQLAGSQHVHVESFAGCMLGQLCPPSLLLALNILECLFFYKHGISSVSLSYAQSTDIRQDLSAVNALRRLADEYLGDVDWHVVIYTYMGLFPETVQGCRRLISDSAKLAKLSGSERLIVKTAAESVHIPSIEDNITALKLAFSASQNASKTCVEVDEQEYDDIYQQANALIQAVLNLSENLDEALSLAFKSGLLDVPYCIHPDNENSARCYINDNGYLKWADRESFSSSNALLDMLSYVKNKYD